MAADVSFPPASFSNIVYFTDRKRRITYWNQAAEELTVAESDGSQLTVTNNSGHVSPADRPSLPAAAASPFVATSRIPVPT